MDALAEPNGPQSLFGAYESTQLGEVKPEVEGETPVADVAKPHPTVSRGLAREGCGDGVGLSEAIQRGARHFFTPSWTRRTRIQPWLTVALLGSSANSRDATKVRDHDPRKLPPTVALPQPPRLLHVSPFPLVSPPSCCPLPLLPSFPPSPSHLPLHRPTPFPPHSFPLLTTHLAQNSSTTSSVLGSTYLPGRGSSTGTPGGGGGGAGTAAAERDKKRKAESARTSRGVKELANVSKKGMMKLEDMFKRAPAKKVQPSKPDAEEPATKKRKVEKEKVEGVRKSPRKSKG